MLVAGRIRVFISAIFLSYCCACSVLAPVIIVVWLTEPHTAVAILLVSGLAIAPMIFLRSGDSAVSVLLPLAVHDSTDLKTVIGEAIAGRRIGQVGVQITEAPLTRPIVIRSLRHTRIVMAADMYSHQVVRELDSGNGWLLPWVMTVLAIPARYVKGFQQFLGVKHTRLTSHFAWNGRWLSWILFPILAMCTLPSIVTGWMVSQLAMLLIHPNVLAGYLSLTGCHMASDKLPLRIRLKLPFVNNSRHVFHLESTDAYVSVAGGLIVGLAMNLVVSGIVESTVWWDEKRFVATVEEISYGGGKDLTVRFLSDLGHHEQSMMVRLPHGQIKPIKSSADTFVVGDTVVIACKKCATKEPQLRAVPRHSTIYFVSSTLCGFLLIGVGLWVISYCGPKRLREAVWVSGM